jgi:hypothetical protein
VFFATGTIAAKKSGFVGWALTLAGRLRGARRLGRRGEPLLVGRGASPLGTATAIPPALGLPLLATAGGLAIVATGVSSSPAPGRGAALGATVSGLGVGGSEELLAPLE